MTEKKSVASFFEKRVLRPSAKVNYLFQDLDLSPPRKAGRKPSVITDMQENKEGIKERIQDSQDLTRLLFKGKTVNPFFDKKMFNVSVKDDVVQLIDALNPNYEDCHVGYDYRLAAHDIFSLFPKRSDKSVNYALGDYKLLQVDECRQSDKNKVSVISMTKMELDEYLYTHFSQDILQEPCIQVLYKKLMGSMSDDGLQWNDKYAPECSQELLGLTNRIYASSLLTYLQEWKPTAAKRIRQVPKKQATYHKLDDLDEFIVSDVDSEFEGFTVSSKHQLIIGPPGSGKTALVSAVAKEANINILEIHTGMKRSGKELISTLGETISSRLVGGKKGTIDPNWFHEKPAVPKKRRKRIVTDSTDAESGIDNDLVSIDSDSTKKPRKKNQKKQTQPKKEITKLKGGITSFFKPIQKSCPKPLDETVEKCQDVIIADVEETETVEKSRKQSQHEKPVRNAADFFKPIPKAGIPAFFNPAQALITKENTEAFSIPESPPREKVIQVENSPLSVSPPPRYHGVQKSEPVCSAPSVEEARIASGRKTVILLDSVDVVTEQDKGFWNGVATLFETSKRPIILCCNGLIIFYSYIENPLIVNNSAIPSTVLEFISNSVESFQICRPEEDELTCYLTLMLLNEGISIKPSLIRKICVANKYDIRQIILFLQMLTRMDNPLVIKEDDCFNFYQIDYLSSFSLLDNDTGKIWKPNIIPDTLEDTLVAFDAISFADHRIKSSYFSDCNIEIASLGANPSCCSFLFPLLTDDLSLPIQTASRDVQGDLQISKCIDDLIDERWKENNVANSDPAALPFYDFPKWPFMEHRLDDTSNLLFWDGSIQSPRCFITEMLPWLSVMLQHSHLIGERDGYTHQKGRTRKSKRKVLRLFENELSDDQFQSVAKRWF